MTNTRDLMSDSLNQLLNLLIKKEFIHNKTSVFQWVINWIIYFSQILLDYKIFQLNYSLKVQSIKKICIQC